MRLDSMSKSKLWIVAEVQGSGDWFGVLGTQAELHGIKVLRFATPFKKVERGGLRPSRLFALIYIFVKFLLFSCATKINLIQRPKAIVFSSTPPMLVFFLVFFSPRSRLIYYALDVFPAALFARRSAHTSPWFARCVYWFCNKSFKRLDRKFTLDSTMAAEMQKFGRCDVAWLWFRRPVWQKEVVIKRGQPVNVLYGGNLSPLHFADLVGLKALCGIIDINFYLTCDGAGARWFRSHMVNTACSIIHEGQLSEKRYRALVKNSNFGLVLLSERAKGICCPSKAVDYIQNGLPVIHVGPRSDFIEYLSENGFLYSPGELALKVSGGDVLKLKELTARNINQVENNLVWKELYDSCL